jgi:hypothetical protein
MRFFRDVLSALLAAAMVVLLFEGSLRLARVWYDASLYQPEMERGYSLRPNAEGWNETENETYVRINSDGMRDHERPVACPPGTLRIAMLGSSEAESRTVPLEKTSASVINRLLDKTLDPLGHSVDVMNFGVPGYTFSQHYLTLHNHVWKYTPQIVLLMLSVPTVFKSTRELSPDAALGTPFYELQGGRLVPDRLTRAASRPSPGRVYWKNHFSDWMNRSALLSLLNQAGFELQRQEAVLAAKLKTTPRSFPVQQVPADSVTRWSYMPDLPETQKAWAIAEAFLDDMRQDCADRGAEFWIVDVDMGEQTHPSLDERVRFARAIRIPSLDATDQRIKRFAETHRIPSIFLAPPLAEFAAAHGVALHGFAHTPFNNGHWNELGHELAGGVIAEQLLERSSVIRQWTDSAHNPPELIKF